MADLKLSAVAYVRMVKTASGATSVQIVHSSRRGSRDVEHIGLARDEVKLEVLKVAARQRLATGQGVPEQVSELTELTGDRLGNYGQYVEPLDGFDAVAGYATSPEVNQATIVVGNSDRTMFKGFADSQNDADRDADAILDGVELWVNLVSGVAEGFGADVPW